MAAGKASPIVEAIAVAQEGTTGEIRVHLSKRLWEPDARRRAEKLFHRIGLDQTKDRNTVLIYVNLRRRKFALVGDDAIHAKAGQRFWDDLARRLSVDLRATNPEKAIALAVLRVGESLRTAFPAV